jgi:hypothetical protein
MFYVHVKFYGEGMSFVACVKKKQIGVLKTAFSRTLDYVILQVKKEK